jgi:hypothetical protein
MSVTHNQDDLQATISTFLNIFISLLWRWGCHLAAHHFVQFRYVSTVRHSGQAHDRPGHHIFLLL